jgi:prevent-host-death family protein
MITISVADAPAKLPELLQTLARGEDIVVTDRGQPVARIVASTPFEAPKPQEDLAAFIARRRADLGLSQSPPPVPEDFDLPTHEDDWMDNPRDPLNEGRILP